MLQLVLRRLKVSEAAAKMATSSAPASRARCKPCSNALHTLQPELSTILKAFQGDSPTVALPEAVGLLPKHD